MYSILRTKKHKSSASLKSRESHTFRRRYTANADPKKKHNNRLLFGFEKYADACQSRLDEYAKTKKIRSDAVVAIEYLLTASPEFFETGPKYERDKRLKSWCDSQLEFLKKKHGADNIMCAYLHLDEKTPHIEAYIFPLDPTGKLNCKYYLGGAKKLTELQTEYAEHNKTFGLGRGVKRSPATHTKVSQFYSMINEKADINIDAVKKALTLDKPRMGDMLKLEEWVSAQQEQLVKKVVELFKGTVYENKLIPQAKKIIKDNERREKGVATMKYKHEKELEKLQDQLKSQLTLLESLQELKLENVELKKQVANLMNDNQAVKLKLQKYEKAPQNFASKN